MVKKASPQQESVKDSGNNTPAQEAKPKSSGFSHEKIETSNFLLIVLTLADPSYQRVQPI